MSAIRGIKLAQATMLTDALRETHRAELALHADGKGTIEAATIDSILRELNRLSVGMRTGDIDPSIHADPLFAEALEWLDGVQDRVMVVPFTDSAVICTMRGRSAMAVKSGDMWRARNMKASRLDELAGKFLLDGLHSA